MRGVPLASAETTKSIGRSLNHSAGPKPRAIPTIVAASHIFGVQILRLEMRLEKGLSTEIQQPRQRFFVKTVWYCCQTEPTSENWQRRVY